MAELSRIVNVAISLNTTGVWAPSFSDMIIVSPHQLSESRMMAVTSLEQLDGLSSSHSLYKAVSACFSQIPRVKQVFIGRVSASKTDVKITQNVIGDYNVTVLKGDIEETATHTATASQDKNAIATALATKLKALSLVADATATDDMISVKAVDCKLTVAGKLDIGESTTTEDYKSAMTEIKKSGGSWYGIAITSRKEADVKAVAEWTEANKRLFVSSSDSSDIVNGAKTTDIASWAKQKQLFRTAIFYDPQAQNEYLECAGMSKLFTYYPGEATWANQRLGGITADNLPEGEAIIAHQKNASTFEMFNDQFAITQQGKVAAGEWIDVIRFRDWLEAEVQAEVVFSMVNADGKLPYTDAGIEIITSSIRRALDLGVTRKGIAPPEVSETNEMIPSYVINSPLSSSISANRKASRVLDDVNFTARLSGAIHATEIKGAVAYEL